MTSDELLLSVVQIIRQSMPAGMRYQVFLFGSRVTGSATERSDYDIGIESDQCVPPGVKGKIDEELEEIPTLRSIDFVDFSLMDTPFSCRARKEKRILYEQ
jgi:predicted nucleotidyltransferase